MLILSFWLPFLPLFNSYGYDQDSPFIDYDIQEEWWDEYETNSLFTKTKYVTELYNSTEYGTEFRRSVYRGISVKITEKS